MLPERRPNRLPDYDYSQSSGYFVTLCTYKRQCFLSTIESDRAVLSDAGRIVEACWHDLPTHYGHVILGDYVIMPNHLHGIIFLTDVLVPKRHALPEIVRALKTFSARHINLLVGEGLKPSPAEPIWQRSFYDHIIRDEQDLERIRQYIAENPMKWFEDQDYQG